MLIASPELVPADNPTNLWEFINTFPEVGLATEIAFKVEVEPETAAST